MTTRSFQGRGAKFAALAQSGDGFQSVVQVELDPEAEVEALRFDLGGLEVSEKTELRVYVWGMEATVDQDGNLVGSDAEYLASSADAGDDAGLRLVGWVENAPPAVIEADIGRTSPRVVIANPGSLSDLPESQRQLLARAGPDDVVDVRYDIYEYLGEATTLDLADEIAFASPGQWRRVGLNETPSGSLPMLASTDGFAKVERGQWVKDRRTIREITLSITEDLDIAATGMVTANSEGDLALGVDGDLQIDNGSRSGLTISGLSANGDVWIEATGSIYVLDSPALSGAVIRSGGDLTLIAHGEDDRAGNASALGGDLVRLGSREVEGDDGRILSEQVALPFLFDLPAASVMKVDAAGDVNLERLSRESRNEASTLQAGGILAGGDLSLKVSDGNLRASTRSWDRGVIHLAGRAMNLDVIDTPASAFTSVAIGDRTSPLVIDADTLQARTRTSGVSVIALQDIDDLVIAGPGWQPATSGGSPVEGGLKIGYEGAILVSARGSLEVQG
ncbi:MAG: hypothetical protein ACKO8O_03780, partial [Betaproteobacteria bacterium]